MRGDPCRLWVLLHLVVGKKRLRCSREVEIPLRIVGLDSVAF